MATNFEPHECVIFVQSTKIGTHENKAIDSIFEWPDIYIVPIMTIGEMLLIVSTACIL